MYPQLLIAVTLVATTADKAKHFRIGPWIIVPILIAAVIVVVPIYIARDRRKRRDVEKEWSTTNRG